MRLFDKVDDMVCMLCKISYTDYIEIKTGYYQSLFPGFCSIDCCREYNKKDNKRDRKINNILE